MSKKAFTLVELMIVIAIIGILAAALFPSMSGYLARSRDSQRVVDTTKIESAASLYITDFGVFPGESFTSDTSCGSSLAGVDGYFTCEGSITSGTGGWDSSGGVGKNFYAFKNYIPKLPVDPLNRSTFYYSYEPYNAGEEFCVTAGCRFMFRIHLENNNSTRVGNDFTSAGNGYFSAIFGQKQK